MMQTLLEDRFHLKIHTETREVPAYLLTVGKGGPKLPATKPGSCKLVDPTARGETTPSDLPYCAVIPPVHTGKHWVWDVRGITMDVLAKRLRVDLPVIDRTGLSGPFDIHLEYAYEESTSSLPDGLMVTDVPQNSIMMAMQDQLGLRLVRAKGPVEFLVMDHIEKASDN